MNTSGSNTTSSIEHIIEGAPYGLLNVTVTKDPATGDVSTLLVPTDGCEPVEYAAHELVALIEALQQAKEVMAIHQPVSYLPA
ncbi:hypothetical protein [Corynebacterium flavescens]|uniref:hypothetical protein n=1 Tax=Corynebacterium flavescens TaxID=28028 RepID=UPI003FD3863B